MALEVQDGPTKCLPTSPDPFDLEITSYLGVGDKEAGLNTLYPVMPL